MEGIKYVNLIKISPVYVVIEIQGIEIGELVVPVNNTLVYHTAFLATGIRPCVLILQAEQSTNFSDLGNNYKFNNIYYTLIKQSPDTDNCTITGYWCIMDSMQLLNFIKFIFASYPATGYVVFEQTIVAFCVHGSYVQLHQYKDYL